jgi:hypothetical protein
MEERVGERRRVSLDRLGLPLSSVLSHSFVAWRGRRSTSFFVLLS